MNEASENGFHNLNLLMPCCGKKSALNELQYDFPCGFACVEFDILNTVSALNKEQLTQIAKLLGCPVRIIDSHL